MAVRKPLVIVDGLIQRLQVGDTIEGGGSTETTTRTNNNAGTINIAQAVYADAAGGVDLAQADAEATSSVIGLVQDATVAAAASGTIRVNGIVTATTTQWDAVTGDVGGLVTDDIYYLNETTPGGLSSTPPATTSEFIVPVGIAMSTTEMKLVDRHRVLL